LISDIAYGIEDMPLTRLSARIGSGILSRVSM